MAGGMRARVVHDALDNSGAGRDLQLHPRQKKVTTPAPLILGGKVVTQPSLVTANWYNFLEFGKIKADQSHAGVGAWSGQERRE